MKKITLILSMMIALVGLNTNAAIYMVGDAPMGGWTYNGPGIEMTDNGDGTYSTVVKIGNSATDAKTVYFAFADGWGTSWDDFNANHRYGPENGGQQLTGEWASVGKYGDRSFTFTGTGDDYVVTFDLNNLQAKIDGYVAPIEITTYSVVGNYNGWDVNSTDDIMTLVNGVYTLNRQNVELQAGTLQYKFIGNHDYGIYEYPTGMNNLTEPVEKHGYYNMLITFVPETQAVTCTLTLVEEIFGDPIYTVAGAPAALFGEEWNPALTQNEMTKGQDGLYTWTKNNVELTAGTVAFKVVLGHDWGNEWPSENYLANIEENGVYDVTITFDPETKDITFEATASVITDDFYTVAGAPASLFGEEWNPELAANNMTLVDGLYTWTKEEVELAAETFIEFKVVKNANWGTCWPANNYEYTVQEAGTYNLTITYDPETNDVVLNVTQPGEPAEITSYTVVGPTAIFGSEWNATDVNNDMALGENGVYTWTKANVTLTGDFSFKVVGNHDYAVYEWPMGFANNYDVTVEEEGIYTILITFDPNAVEDARITCTLTKTGDVTPNVRGDVTGEGDVNMDDLTALINYLLTSNGEGMNLANAAACDGEEGIGMDDLTALINYLLTNQWPAVEPVYTVAGTENLFGSNWDPTDQLNDMVKGEDGIYRLNNKAGYFEQGTVIEFKVVKDRNWDYAWPSSNWYIQIPETGAWNFNISFNPDVEDALKIAVDMTQVF